jgi:hypothetical protein
VAHMDVFPLAMLGAADASCRAVSRSILLRDEEAVGSNPATPTSHKAR